MAFLGVLGDTRDSRDNLNYLCNLVLFKRRNQWELVLLDLLLLRWLKIGFTEPR